MPTEIKTKIAGVTHDNRQRIIKEYVRAGQPLLLLRELDNPVDPDAVAVWLPLGKKRHQLGYLSADRAEIIAPLLDDGWSAEAVVQAVTGGTLEKPTRGVNIIIKFTEPNPEADPQIESRPENEASTPPRRPFWRRLGGVIILLSIVVVLCCCLSLFAYYTVDTSLRDAGILPTYTPTAVQPESK